jgi:hypothetical protein
MDGTVKYLTFCQDSHTPNRFLAEKLALALLAMHFQAPTGKNN